MSKNKNKQTQVEKKAPCTECGGSGQDRRIEVDQLKDCPNCIVADGEPEVSTEE